MARNHSLESTAESPFHVITKPNGPACNLECEYCFYLDREELYTEQSDFAISDETLETFIQQYIEAQPGPIVTFTWQGGEPTLLGVSFYQKVIQYQEKHAPDDIQIQNTLQTNGTLLNEELCQFLSKHNFLVGISIDGPEDLHNRFRRTRSDGSTFEQVMNGLSLLEEYGIEYNALCVVNAVNSRHPQEVYEFFKDQGIEWIQFIPLVEPLDTDDTGANGGSLHDQDRDYGESNVHRIPEWVRDRGGIVERQDEDYTAVVEKAREAPVTARSVDPMVYGEFMCEVFDEWIRNDVTKISVRLFEQCLETVLRGEASLCVFRKECGSQLVVEHNGDVYACDHFVDPGFKRGNIHSTHLAALVDAPEQQQFGRYKREGLPPRCRDCDVREFCHGGCPKNWHLTTPDDAPGLNYLCAGYRRFFTYVQPYLNLVEQTIDDGLPLPLVMPTVAALDEGAVPDGSY